MPADEAFFAWASYDIDLMLAALDTPTNCVDRHHLLSELAKALFERRHEAPEYLSAFLQVAMTHLNEAPGLIRELQAERVAHRQSMIDYLVAKGRSTEAWENSDAWKHWGVFATHWRLLDAFLEQGDFTGAVELISTAQAVGVADATGAARMQAAVDKAQATQVTVPKPKRRRQ